MTIAFESCLTTPLNDTASMTKSHRTSSNLKKTRFCNNFQKFCGEFWRSCGGFATILRRFCIYNDYKTIIQRLYKDCTKIIQQLQWLHRFYNDSAQKSEENNDCSMNLHCWCVVDRLKKYFRWDNIFYIIIIFASVWF